MSKIRILPEQLANQIAAGEVVERPASVVKELVENSLDAGATRIEIEIEGGGTRLIRVIDNGEGMGEDDLLMSLERHGTSKIHSEEDLGSIGTLGFRGEAIPSIGSVAQLTITSRPPESELGTRIVLSFGKLQKVHDIGCSYGTTFEVRNLFGNTPARRKFLRTVRTEIGHIDEVIKNYSLCSPEITFILRINGRETNHLDKSLSIEERLRNIIHYEGPFISVSTSSATPHKYAVSGFLIPPEQATPGPARLRLMVNGRAVKDRMIAHGVTEGLRGFLMKGKNPVGLIHLTLPDNEVDVNVHPAKHEVRFRQSQDVHAFLSSSVGRAIQEYQHTLKNQVFGIRKNIESSPIPANTDFPVQSPFTERPTDTARHVHSFSSQDIPETREAQPTHTTAHPPSQNLRTDLQPQTIFATTGPIHKSNEETSITKNQLQNTTSQQFSRYDLVVIGQFDNLYIFCKSSEGLIVIDQHAAHERLLYEKFREQYLLRSITRQNLMFPETVELSLFQAKLVDKNSEELERMGFSFREFGGNTFILSAVPALAGTTSPRELFLDVLCHFGDERSKNSKGGFLDTILATMACKAAVKAGTELSDKEINTLLDDMAKADLFSHCPHGRPVVKVFNSSEIKKWFYRT